MRVRDNGYSVWRWRRWDIDERLDRAGRTVEYPLQ